MYLKKRLLVAALFCSSMLAPLHAALEFEQTHLVLEAGIVDTRAEAVFKFTNTSEREVTITGMQSSCGCTVPQLDKKTYPPGESGEIRALFNFGARTGEQRKSVEVRTDDPQAAIHNLSFEIDIPVWCTLEPQILRWRLGEPMQPQAIRLVLLDPEKISLASAPSDVPGFKVEPVSSEAGELVFSVTPLELNERATEKLTFTLRGEDPSGSDTREFSVYCLVR